jgi:hypothetical protein
MNDAFVRGGAGRAIGIPCGARSEIVGRISFRIGKQRNAATTMRKVAWTNLIVVGVFASIPKIGNK